ncbi:hypothetical protein [Solimicrobium silvestre]|uniref:MetA-pathway of phenol degradation n=1 Tax=Solimicrobium silvestre TaxID=2099400 RepID=A0A2S9H5M4_9BURK|nr:hypothetical protein [Solimicrobium silvestre]PRC95241.1 hypothetical protein S2091_0436 [Solimicrobium silvestre]
MKIVIASSALIAVMFSTPVLADPDDSILTNYSENGLRQIDFKLGSLGQTGQPSQDASTLGFGYGFTENWFSEIYVGYVKIGSGATEFDSAAWQNTFLLTNSQSPVDVGLYTEIEYEHDRTAGEQLTFGPLLQTELGLTKINFNLLFQRNYFADFSNPMQMGYQWQVKQHLNLPVDLGIQGFGEFGQWDHWAAQKDQSHRLGPALFGKIALSEKNVINYNAAILFDVFDQTHATTFRMQAVLGF